MVDLRLIYPKLTQLASAWQRQFGQQISNDTLCNHNPDPSKILKNVDFPKSTKKTQIVCILEKHPWLCDLYATPICSCHYQFIYTTSFNRIYIYTYICMYTCMYIYHIHLHVHVTYTCMYIIYIYIYTEIYMCTYNIYHMYCFHLFTSPHQ